MPAKWEQIAQQKQHERASRIPKDWLVPLPSPIPSDVRSYALKCGLLTPAEIAITSNHDATSLAHQIRTRQLSATAVATAFCKRAAIAQQLCNCLTEIFFDDGIKRAQWLDAELARTGKPVGPLHGVPVSLKDTFKVKGYDASTGIASMANQPARENSLLVDILLDAGAVLYCKTGVPQTLMCMDSENHLFGQVLNPRNRAVTAGGSSGGEGALIAMRGSVLGIGTDIGGSIRIPAMCNGLYGIKPSMARVPYIGQASVAVPGSEKIGLPASAGPLAASLRDCELLLKVVADAKPWESDPAVSFGAWESQGSLVNEKKPLIGVIYTDDVMTPHPPIQKVLQETVSALRVCGSEVIPISAPQFKKCQSLANSFFGIDGNNHVLDLLAATSEPLVTWLSSRLRRKKPADMKTLLELHVRRTELQTEMLKMWKDPKSGRTVDAIILPVAPHPTPPIDRWNGVGYTSSFVLLDYPAGTMPIRDVKIEDLELGKVWEECEKEPLSNWDKVNRDLWNEKTVDRKTYLDTTLCVQVVAPKLQERRLYEAMELVDNAMRASKAKL